MWPTTFKLEIGFLKIEVVSEGYWFHHNHLGLEPGHQCRCETYPLWERMHPWPNNIQIWLLQVKVCKWEVSNPSIMLRTCTWSQSLLCALTHLGENATNNVQTGFQQLRRPESKMPRICTWPLVACIDTSTTISTSVSLLKLEPWWEQYQHPIFTDFTDLEKHR